MNIIKCCVCKKDKPETEFSFFHGRRNRSCQVCRSYHNAFYKDNSGGYRDKRKQYYEGHKTEHRKRMYRNHIKRKYDLTIEQLNQMVLAQNNKCAICERNFNMLPKWNSLCVDHSHKTGKVRGLLCRKCNLMLVYIEDLNLWEKAQKYLVIKDQTISSLI